MLPIFEKRSDKIKPPKYKGIVRPMENVYEGHLDSRQQNHFEDYFYAFLKKNEEETEFD